MKYQKPTFLSIFATAHALLFLGLLYPLAAGMILSTASDFWRFCASCLVLFIPLIIERLLLYKVNNLFVYTLLSIFLIIITAKSASLISGIVAALLTTGCSIFIFLVHCLCKMHYGQIKGDFIALHGEDAEFTLPGPETSNLLIKPDMRHLIWNSVLYAIGMVLNLRLSLYVMFGMTVIDLFFIIGYQYGDALHSYIIQRQHVANLPVTTMKRIHKAIGVLGALILTLFLLPGILYGHEFEVHLKTGISDFSQQAYAPKEFKFRLQDNPLLRDLADKQKPESPVWLKILSKTIEYVAFALCVLFIINQIIRSLRIHTKEFSTNEQDEAVFLKASDSKQVVSSLQHRKGESHLSANQQIRRRYRNTIRKATKGQPNHCATPSELEQAASLPDNEATARLHTYYEKARYSESGCSSEELHALR